jgi:hypothetical protein
MAGCYLTGPPGIKPTSRLRVRVPDRRQLCGTKCGMCSWEQGVGGIPSTNQNEDGSLNGVHR